MKLKNTTIFLCLLMIFLINDLFARSNSGTRVDLTEKLNLDGAAGQFAQLFVPDNFQSNNNKFTLVFHLHSANWTAEDEVINSHINAILFNIHLGGFSSAYGSEYFVDQDKFQMILDTILSVIDSKGIINDPEIEYLIMTSFSAGYGGVREILKSENYYNKIDALTLADGLHCSSYQSTADYQMKDFVHFAKDGRDKKKIFTLTHSSIQTYDYQNTTQTSDYLVQKIGAKKRSFSANDEIGEQYARCDTGYFHIKSYYGTTAEDHLKHLYNMDKMLVQVNDTLDSATVNINYNNVNPRTFELFQNYPNPFNSVTNVPFELTKSSLVKLSIYDISGKLVKTLVNERKNVGDYSIKWNGENSNDQLMASGIYAICLVAEKQNKVKRAILLK